MDFMERLVEMVKQMLVKMFVKMVMKMVIKMMMKMMVIIDSGDQFITVASKAREALDVIRLKQNSRI